MKDIPFRSAASDGTPRSQTVLELLRSMLLDGKLPPGQRLNEVRLSREFDVSRTPVRAALQTLAGEGLLEYQPNRGYIVRGFALSEIVDGYEMRALAEGLAARLAAERGLDPATHAEIERSLAVGDRVLNDPKADLDTQRAAYGDVNRRIHGAIHEAAGSRLVQEVVRLCQRVPHTSAHNIMAFEIADVRRRHADHHKIYEAVICREPRQAETLMRAHVLGVKLSVARSLARLDIEKNQAQAAAGIPRLRTRQRTA